MDQDGWQEVCIYLGTLLFMWLIVRDDRRKGCR
jgi:hypothetical protein